MVKRGTQVDLRLLHFFRVARGFKDTSNNKDLEKKDKAVRLAKAAQVAVQKTINDGVDKTMDFRRQPLPVPSVPSESQHF